MEFHEKRQNIGDDCIHRYILHFTFLFSLFVFVSAAGHYFGIWTGQVPALIFLDKKYNIANSSCHFGSHSSIWTGPFTQNILYGPKLLRSI